MSQYDRKIAEERERRARRGPHVQASARQSDIVVPRLTFEQRRAKVQDMRRHPERREFSALDFELREAPSGILRFAGYASITERPYEVGFYTEVVRRGAFKRTLSENPDVQLLINHGAGGSGMPIARTGRNMTLTEDERGLRVEAKLDSEDPDVVLLARKMKNGLIDQMSFAFQATDDAWNEEYTERTIRAASIHRGDVSVVNQGASPSTSAAISQRDRAAVEFYVIDFGAVRRQREDQMRRARALRKG